MKTAYKSVYEDPQLKTREIVSLLDTLSDGGHLQVSLSDAQGGVFWWA